MNEPADTNEKTSFLRQASAYPHNPDIVTPVETHMSWVFLAGEFAFKLKKPVRYAYLDFTTLEAREFACREEVKLNARLAPSIYIGVVPVCRRNGVQLTLGGDGPVVDWLVKMKRLPADRMLDWCIEHGKVDTSEIDAVALRLISFYKSAAPVSQTLEQVHGRFAAEHERDSEILELTRFEIDQGRTARTLRLMKKALTKVRPLLQVRIDQRVYVEGHGDLRPEHVCLLSEPVIIDCLEFNRDLRILDPYDEAAFLDLECERLGAAWIGSRFLSHIQREMVHPASLPLMRFYRAARAMLRARLALAHLLEPNPRAPEKWEPRARQYIGFAEAALEQFHGGVAAQARSRS